MTKETAAKVFEKISSAKIRGAWNNGVKAYALEILDNYFDALRYGAFDLDRSAALNGARNWKDYSYSGNAFVYDGDIAERLCNPSELKRNGHGSKNPNARENWLDVQARALYQAWAWIFSIGYSLEA